MKDKDRWADVIRQWFEEAPLPEFRRGDAAGSSRGYAAPSGATVWVVTRTGRFRGDLLGVTELCLILFRGGRLVAFIDWAEIAAICVRPFLPHALQSALDAICEVVKKSPGSGDEAERNKRRATNLLKATLASLKGQPGAEAANARRMLVQLLVAILFEPLLEERSDGHHRGNQRALIRLLALAAAQGKLDESLTQALAVCNQLEKEAIGQRLEAEASQLRREDGGGEQSYE